MNHVGKSGASPHIEQLALAPKQVQQHARPEARAMHGPQGREHITLVPTSGVDAEAGVHPDKQGRLVNLAHNAAVAMRLKRGRYVPMCGAHGPHPGREDEDDEKAAFRAAVNDALTFLGEDSGRRHREQLEQQLERYFDPVQRLKVLVESLQQAQDRDLPERQKVGVSRAIDGLITSLMRKHPREIRAVLQETDPDPMAEDMDSLARMRLLIGAKDAGRFDTPLSPLTVLKALIRNFGSRALMAMNGLRTRMMSGL